MNKYSCKTATGPIRYGMTNDFMFRAVLEANPVALKGLICSLLRLEPEEITSITITNLFQLGKSVLEKDTILDIKVLLNDQTYINLEMQVAREAYWTERSLTYLCRTYDNLKTSGRIYYCHRALRHLLSECERT